MSHLSSEEELSLLRQKISTLEDIIRRNEKELSENKEKISAIHSKTAEWKEKVRKLICSDRERIAELENEVETLTAARQAADNLVATNSQSIVDNAVALLRDEYEQKLKVKQEELLTAVNTIKEREDEMEKVRLSIGKLQEQYLELQERSANEINSLVAHHEKEKLNFQERLGGPDIVSTLQRCISEQKEKISVLENQAASQVFTIEELQKAISELGIKNKNEQKKLADANTHLKVMKTNQHYLEEVGKGIAVKDAQTTPALQKKPKKLQHNDSSNKNISHYMEEKHHQWRPSEEEEKVNLVRKNQNLMSDIHNYQQQTTEYIAVIYKIADMLEEIPFNAQRCKEITTEHIEKLKKVNDRAKKPAEISLDSYQSSASTCADNHNEEPDNSLLKVTRLQMQLQEAVRRREETEQQLALTTSELEALRERGSSDATELREQLQEAVRRREETEQQLALTTSELEALRERSSSDATELREQLQEAVRRREDIEKERKKLEADVKGIVDKYEIVVEEKVTALRVLEEKVLSWKEKVLATKTKDNARIEDLEGSLSSLHDDFGCFRYAVFELLTLLDETLTSDKGNTMDTNADVKTCLGIVESAQKRILGIVKSLFASQGTNSVAGLLLSLNANVIALQNERETLSGDLQSCMLDLEMCKSRLNEAESKISCLPSNDALAELKSRNAHLEEKCELLRKEIRRQKMCLQAEGPEGVQSSTVARQQVGAERGASDVVFFEDGLPRVGQKELRDNELCRLRTQLLALEKENSKIKHECEESKIAVAECAKEIEAFKAKEKIQQSLEYVRNIIFQFLCCSDEGVRLQMVPAIVTALGFTRKERSDVQKANPACPKIL